MAVVNHICSAMIKSSSKKICKYGINQYVDFVEYCPVERCEWRTHCIFGRSWAKRCLYCLTIQPKYLARCQWCSQYFETLVSIIHVCFPGGILANAIHFCSDNGANDKRQLKCSLLLGCIPAKLRSNDLTERQVRLLATPSGAMDTTEQFDAAEHWFCRCPLFSFLTFAHGFSFQ
eukprot:6209463-Pleurochrysis_carterae.AAC.3